MAVNIRKLEVMPGDIFLTRGSSWVSRAIRKFQRSPGEPKSWVNHVGMFMQETRFTHAIGIEALHTVKQHNVYDRYKRKKEMIAIARYEPFVKQDRYEVSIEASRFTNAKYGYAKIGGNFGDYLLSKIKGKEVFFFRNRFKTKRRPICSILDSLAYATKKVLFLQKDPKTVQPDDIWDEIVKNPDWVFILPLTRI